MKTIIHVLIVCSVLALLLSCKQEVGKTELLGDPAASTNTALDEAGGSIGGSLAAKSCQTSTCTGSWDDVVDRLPLQDANFLAQMRQRYFGSVAYANEEERRFLEEAGFPSIHEWLEARSMSDEAIEAWAATGDGKAMVFHIDRMIERASPYLHLRGHDDVAFHASTAPSYALSAYEYSTRVQFTHRSPFTGYLLGAMFSTLSFPQSAELAAAGILAAGDAGDPRATTFLAKYKADHRDMDEAAILAARRALSVPR